MLSHEMVQSVGYFLCGYVKSMDYANKPATIAELRTNIECEIAAVSADLCLKVFKTWVQRPFYFIKKSFCGVLSEKLFSSIQSVANVIQKFQSLRISSHGNEVFANII